MSLLQEPLERIAVLRALPGLGDFLCAVPALRALRAAQPAAEITLIGLPANAVLAERYPEYIDALVPFPGFPGIPEVPLQPARTVAFLAEAQRRPFDLAIQLHGSGTNSNPFVALLGARRSTGFVLPGLPAPAPELYFPYPADQPEPIRQLALIERLGWPADDPALEFPLLAGDESAWEELADRHGLASRGYACVHPGASLEGRRWPAERFAAVADALSARGLRVVLTGSRSEGAVTGAVAAAMRTPAVDLAGQTALGTLAALLDRAAVTLTNDTGTSHLAAAVRAPSAVVFSASDPHRWAPLDRERHRALGLPRRCEHARTDGLCLRDGCRRLRGPELTEVTVIDAVAACDALLAAAPPADRA